MWRHLQISSWMIWCMVTLTFWTVLPKVVFRRLALVCKLYIPVHTTWVKKLEKVQCVLVWVLFRATFKKWDCLVCKTWHPLFLGPIKSDNVWSLLPSATNVCFLFNIVTMLEILIIEIINLIVSCRQGPLVCIFILVNQFPCIKY